MRLRTLAFWLLLVPFAGAAGLLTVARIAQLDGGAWVRLVSFTPLAMVAYAVCTLLLLGKLARPAEGRRRWPWALVLVVIVAALGLHVWWLAPLFTGPNPPPAAKATPITVLTANALRGDIDVLALVDAAVNADADVLIVSEITPGTVTTMERAGVAQNWPFRAGVALAGTHGTMVFSRFELTEVTPLGTRFKSWSLTVDVPDGELRLLAVHPYPPVDAPRWRADHSAILKASTGADLIVGDFNATRDHAPMRALEGRGFHDVAERANQGWQPTWPQNGLFRIGGLALPPLVQIDHVLIGPNLAALSNRTIRVDGTDHAIVVAEVAAR